MAMTIDLRSTIIGFLLGLLVSYLPLNQFGLFQFSEASIGLVILSCGFLGGLGGFLLLDRPRKGQRNVQKEAQEHLRSLFPAGAPADYDWTQHETALTPEEWASEVGMTTARDGASLSFIEKALAEQLTDGDPELAKALSAALCLASLKVRESYWGLSEIARQQWIRLAGSPAAPFKAAPFIEECIARDRRVGDMLTEIQHQHAFPVTRLLAALLIARRSKGVFASAEFLWLKAVDRTLWYATNNLGRKAFHVEGLGAIEHFFAEREARASLPSPQVDRAAEGLKEYMRNGGYLPRELGECPYQAELADVVQQMERGQA